MSGNFKIDSVEVDPQISGDGHVGFMGSQVGICGSAGIKFKFNRYLNENQVR